MRARPAALLATAVLALAGLAACGGPSFDADAEDFGEAEHAEVRLDDGTRLRVGATGGRNQEGDVVVQWSEDGERWTEPEVVLEEQDDHYVSAIEIDQGGSTALVDVTWAFVDEGEDVDEGGAVICRELTCGPVVDDSEGTTGLSDDGEVALLSQDEETGAVTLWDGGEDVRTEKVSGPDGRGAGLDRGEQRVVLVDDGGLATVTGRLEDRLCVYDLWVGEPGSVALERAATTSPLAGGECSPGDLVLDDGEVGFTSVGTEQVRFAASGSSWAEVEEGGRLLATANDGGETAIGMRPVTGPDLAVAVGSPDLRRIVGQVAGEDGWSEPRTLVTAPADVRCRYVDQERALDVPSALYVVACWPAAAPWSGVEKAGPPTVGWVIGTDGERWVVERLERPGLRVDRITYEEDAPLLWVPGAETTLTWRAGAPSFRPVRLAMDPVWDGIGFSSDLRVAVKAIGNGDPAVRCRPRATWALVGDARWRPDEPVEVTYGDFGAPSVCQGSVGDDQRGPDSSLRVFIGLGDTGSPRAYARASYEQEPGGLVLERR